MLGAAKQLSRKLRMVPSEVQSRCFASLPEPVTAHGAEVLRLSATAPVLLGLRERVWGASSVLPEWYLPQGERPGRVGVIRDAFASASGPGHSLADVVASTAEGAVAVASPLSQYHRRLVVDEYELTQEGKYVLCSVATDFLRLLKRESVRVSHVPNVRAATLEAINSVRAARSGVRQSTNEVLMVSPTAFGFNDQAAQDNSFMHSSTHGLQAAPGSGITDEVLHGFAGLHRELSEVAGVKVNLFQHSLEHGTPDAVFPNNWFSTHPAGEAAGGTQEHTLVFYPMKCPNRAMERRLDMQSVLRSKGYTRVLDLSAAEKEGKHFEGTGVLVLDRINGVAYVALSERADADIARHWVDKLGYKDLVTFHSSDTHGKPVYHTNVMMAIGTDVAVVCSESVTDERERQHLLARLSNHHEVVDISQAQMASMCGNVLELEDGRGLPVFAMSTQAHNAFTPEQRAVLRRHVAELHHAPIDSLEFIGGGGVRCALAEVF